MATCFATGVCEHYPWCARWLRYRVDGLFCWFAVSELAAARGLLRGARISWSLALGGCRWRLALLEHRAQFVDDLFDVAEGVGVAREPRAGTAPADRLLPNHRPNGGRGLLICGGS
jgi:hypothetical protein